MNHGDIEIPLDEFKKAPSNRGLRPIKEMFLKRADIIQKSPIKSGIKTLDTRRQSSDLQIQKSPITSGIKTLQVLRLRRTTGRHAAAQGLYLLAHRIGRLFQAVVKGL